ncbi:hypothetical protein CEE37_14780 [candidate division LCP-89 bacterium B3_LCP]|uniref:Uncharacterized protein n=1 Tax=candidate division LCP-89 bacterium B3_LCP TaxID=2012998 RepID=A0A532UPH8_UNCL8|nr:MAG: hypothetical protein CEE37_14780 [candidate division LCP-89 bacterium B3_LCP]
MQGIYMRILVVILVTSSFYVALLFNCALATTSEDLYGEVVFLRGLELGAGGRALALGGAYRAISEDLSALYWNPAGLATIRRLEVGIGISQSMTQDDASISTTVVSNQLSKTRLNELGMVLPFPTYRGSLVFALGYHQVRQYDSFGTFQEITSSYNFQGDELEAGRLGKWALGGAIDVSPVVSVGLALNFWTGYDDYSYNGYQFEDSQNWQEFDQAINWELSGFNLITGVLLRPAHWLRIGASLESPLKLKVGESYSELGKQLISGVYTESPFAENYDYKVSYPFRAGLGTAVTLGPLGLSSDVVFNDWSQIMFSGEPPFTGLDREEANREIARLLRPTVDLHFGAELWVPASPVRIQAGYAWLPSPFKDDNLLTDKHIFSGGINTLLDQALLAQATLAWTGWDRTLGGWGENLQFTHLLLTLSYRF